MLRIESPFLILTGQAIAAEQQEYGNWVTCSCKPNHKWHISNVEQVDTLFGIIEPKEMVEDHHQDGDALDDRTVLSGYFKHISLLGVYFFILRAQNYSLLPR